MDHDHRQTRAGGGSTVGPPQRGAVGKSTRSGDLHAVAADGTASMGGLLPYLDNIQAAFGHHDVGEVRAHIGGPAADAAGAMGARAFAFGDDVGFAETPDLHLAAHEAAHVVQQRGGVRLSGGVGQRGDAYEVHADLVADRVVRGESAEALLDTMAHRGATGGRAVQRDEPAEPASDRHRRDGGEQRATLRRLDEADEAYEPDAAEVARRGRNPTEGGPANTRARPAEPTTSRGRLVEGEMTEEDHAAGARMQQPRILDPAAPSTPAAARPRGARFEASEGEGAGNGRIGGVYQLDDVPAADETPAAPGAASPPAAPDASAGASMGFDGTARAELQGGSGSGGNVTYNASDGTLAGQGRYGRADGSHVSAQVRVRDGHLVDSRVEGQVGRSSGGNVRAGVTADARGRITRAELSGQGGRVGGYRRRFGGKVLYQATFGSPTLNRETQQYDVTVTLAITVDVTAGGAGRHAGLTAGAGMDLRERTVCHFGSREDAQRWVDGEQPELDETVFTLLTGRLDRETAMALQSGEEVEVSQGLHLDGGASLGLAELSARLQVSATLIYRRVDDHTFRVGRRVEGGGRVAPGMETPVAGDTITFEHLWRSGRVVEFDCSTPGGSRMLALTLDIGHLPPGDRGDGWRVVERSQGHTDSQREELDLLGSNAVIEGRTTVDVVTDEHGNRDVTAQGTDGLAVADNNLDGGDDADDARTTTTTIDLNDAGAHIDEAVTAEDPLASQQALAAASGTPWSLPHGERRQSGTWHVEAQLSNAQMETVYARICAGEGRHHAHLLGIRANLVAVLYQACRRAGSAEEARPAVASFVRAGGSDANQFLRTLAGGTIDVDISMEGSSIFQGAEGRRQFEHALDQLEATMSAHPDDPTLEASARRLLREQQDRVSAIRDTHTYLMTEQLHRRELAANAPLLERARQLLRGLEAAARHRETTAAVTRNAEEVAEDEAAAASGRAPRSTAASVTAGADLEAQSAALLASMHGDEQHMLAARRRVVQLKRAVQAESDVHHTPSPGNGIAPIELFTGFGGDAENDYAVAQRETNGADQLLDEARPFYSEYEVLRPRVPDAGVLDAAARARVEELRRTCWLLTTSYQRAQARLELARRRYVAIRHRHDDVRFWGRTHAPAAAED